MVARNLMFRVLRLGFVALLSVTADAASLPSSPVPSAATVSTTAPRTIDMTQVLTDEAGKPAPDTFYKEPPLPGAADPDPMCLKCPRLTLGHSIAHALLAPLKSEPDEQKWGKGVLATRIKDQPDAQLSSEELTVIKRVLTQSYPAIVLMQAMPMLDPADHPAPLK